MYSLTKGILIMALLASNPAKAKQEGPDVAAIKTLVESVATLADTQNFDALEHLYWEEILVDYSSLSGVEAELKSPQALMSEWANLLPGFDRTRHAISNTQVSLDGAMAAATADVTADHYLGDQYWRVSGLYHYELIKVDDRWHISAAKFELVTEDGTRDILASATANAAARPAAYITRMQTASIVETMLSALESKDMEQFAAVWATDAVQDMPYSPPGHPKRVTGKQNIVELYAQWPENSGKADFTSDLVFYPMLDPHTIFVEFKGDVEVVPTGRRYRQNYGGLFHVMDGKIALFREYYDPAPFAWAFGLEGAAQSR